MINWFWFQFSLICIVGAMSPGPSLALIIRNSIKFGRLSGLLSSIGHAIGIGIYAAVSIAGLQLILISNIIVMLIFVQIALYLPAHSYWVAPNNPFGFENVGEYQNAFNSVFSVNGKLLFGSMLAYMVAQLLDVRLYHMWKKITKGKYLWIRNNGSTSISQFISTVEYSERIFDVAVGSNKTPSKGAGSFSPNRVNLPSSAYAVDNINNINKLLNIFKPKYCFYILNKFFY